MAATFGGVCFDDGDMGGGEWNLYRYKIDLFKGLESLISSYEAYQDKVYTLCYGSLVEIPHEITGAI
ncbi:MAG: hypothetical protein R2865_13000 [Deinococcales bacterium]